MDGRVRALALVVIFALCLFHPTDAVRAETTGELVVGTEAETSSMDPMKAWVTYGLIVSRLMYDAPVEFGPDGELTPSLADKWEALDDLTWRFYLRKDVKFHNGYPVKAEDVKFTVDRIKDPANKCRFASRYANFAQVKVIDDHTFDIITGTPDPLLPNRVAFFIRVVSKRWVEENGNEALAKRGMGTGPFKFVSWSRKDRLVLEANTAHFKSRPKVKRVVIRPIPEMAARMAELRAGSVHLVTNVPPFMVSQLEADHGVWVDKVPSTRTMFMVINTRDVPELKNRQVRQALNYAVDKSAIIKGIMGGQGDPVGLPAPPGVAGVDPSIKPYAYDPQKAKTLLAEAGYPKGFDLNVYSPSGRYPMDKEIAQAVAEQLGRVGVRVNLSVMETQKYFADYIKKRMRGIGLIGFGYAYADQDSMVNFLLTNGAYSYFGGPELDGLVARMRSELNQQARFRLASEIQHVTHDECPMIFLFNMVNIYGLSSKIKGFKARSDDYLDLHLIEIK